MVKRPVMVVGQDWDNDHDIKPMKRKKEKPYSVWHVW